jgi:cytochrome b561
MIKKIGSFVAVLGLLAIVFGFFNRVPKILMWMYEWGEGAAWAIKIGLVVVGAALYFWGGKQEEKS